MRRRALPTLLVSASLAALVASLVAFEAPATEIPSAMPTSSASAPAPSVPSATLEPPSDERSPVPTAAEWAAATELHASRTSPRAKACRLTRVREWLRVRCAVDTFAISLLGGSNEGLSFWIGPPSEGRFGEVQMPLRRGDRRVVQLWGTKTDPAGVVEIVPSIVVQEAWVEGEPGPIVTVL